MKSYISTTFVVAGSVLLGMYLGDKYMGKGETMAALCVMGDVAVEQGYLSDQQLIELSEKTGQEIKSKYPQLAETLGSIDRSIAGDLSHSNCTKVVNYLIKGMQ